MKKTVLASAVLLAMAGAASATPDFGTITIDGKTADSSALATETNGIVKIEGTSEKEAFKTESDLTIRGKEIRFERITADYTETTRIQGDSQTVIGGAETELIHAKGGDGFVVLAKNGVPTLDLNAKNIVIEATGTGIWAQNKKPRLSQKCIPPSTSTPTTSRSRRKLVGWLPSRTLRSI